MRVGIAGWHQILGQTKQPIQMYRDPNTEISRYLQLSGTRLLLLKIPFGFRRNREKRLGPTGLMNTLTVCNVLRKRNSLLIQRF